MTLALILTMLACNPGDRLIDLSGKLPRTLKTIDLLISVEPFYARLYVYQPGFPDSTQSCCRNLLSSVLKVPVIDGRFCIRQSQPKMRWKLQILGQPGEAA